ncbi:ABC transporter permease [archaeon]|nr:ABC transporter permease [archaeon]
MSELEVIYIVWQRELKRYTRERVLVLSTIFMSLLWLVIFGIGVGSMQFGRMIGNYQAFLFPGIIGMALLVTSIRSGISIIRDAEQGFLRVVLLAPVSRPAIVLGKALGGSTVALFQGVVILLLSFIVDVSMNPAIFLYSIGIMALMALGLVSMGLLIASFQKSFEGFNLIMSLLIMPMFFLSGSLFPIRILPGWMKTLTYINPLTYGVDALRTVIIGTSAFPILTDLAVLAGFSFFMLAAAFLTFERR